MENRGERYELRITGGEGVLTLEGELSQDNTAEFEGRLRALRKGRGGKVTLDLSALDIMDGPAVATTINCLRELRARTDGLVLRGAPQMLGHNLYRAGMLDGKDAIELVDMRLDEPAGY